MRTFVPGIVFVSVGLLVSVSTLTTNAVTSGNSVSTSRAGEDLRSVAVDDKKPVECASITLTSYVNGTANLNGTASNELITGGATADTIRGRGGSDCILGGSGDDSLRGDGGTDVCIGGPGTDTFDSTCETAIQ